MKDRKTPRYGATDMIFARGLGWLSVGLGLIDIFGRRGVAERTGLPNEPLIALYGVREIATGLGLILADDPMPWVWARVGGDALDVGTLAAGVSDRNPEKSGAVAGLLMVLGIAAIDVALAGRLHATAEREATRPLIGG